MNTKTNISSDMVHSNISVQRFQDAVRKFAEVLYEYGTDEEINDLEWTCTRILGFDLGSEHVPANYLGAFVVVTPQKMYVSRVALQALEMFEVYAGDPHYFDDNVKFFDSLTLFCWDENRPYFLDQLVEDAASYVEAIETIEAV